MNSAYEPMFYYVVELKLTHKIMVSTLLLRAGWKLTKGYRFKEKKLRKHMF